MGSKKLGKTVIDAGRVKLVPLPVPEDRVSELERVPQGIAALENPDARGVFTGKLKRGRKAKLTAANPADKGIALMAMRGAMSVPLYMGVAEPGIHFSGGGQLSLSGHAAIVFAPAAMKGDDVAITCTGEFPAQVDALVAHLSASKKEAAEHTFTGSSSSLELVVSTVGMTDGIVFTTLDVDDGKARIEKCVVRREAP